MREQVQEEEDMAIAYRRLRGTRGGTYKAKDSNVQVSTWVSWEWNEKGEIEPGIYSVG